MKRVLQFALLFCSFGVCRTQAATWFVRADGGTRYSTNVPTGQCNGQYDAAYPGSGANQNCAYNDFRYLYDDDSGQAAQFGWVISGGDTVVIRGCQALATQVNPSNPNCRIGWDAPTQGGSTVGNLWCPSSGSFACYSPPVPSGTSGNPTRILGACAYGTYTCNPVGHSYPYTSNNLTQLFCGFGLYWCFNLSSTSYVEIEGIELTTHNQHWNGTAWSGNCTDSGFGTPSYPVACGTYFVPPVDDYARYGFVTDTTNATSSPATNITMQDVYVHGFTVAGLYGPIGAGWSVTNLISAFNAFAAWDFNDEFDDPDGTSTSLALSYVWMEGNGCYEQYPIVNTQFPARACYDTYSGGFGDSLSGQDAVMDSISCNHCTIIYNTKDGWIGPHVQVTTNTITNSFWYGNMGVALKWGNTNPGTSLFQNNLVVGNCTRMATQIPGASQSFAAVPILSYTHPSSGVFLFELGTPSHLLTTGEQVTLFGFSAAGVPLNGMSVTVLSTGLSSSQFEANISGQDSLATDAGGAGQAGAYLTDFCRALGTPFQTLVNLNTTQYFYGNTVITANRTDPSPTIVDIGTCGYGDNTGTHLLTNCPATSTVTWKNNLFLGYTFSGNYPPALWYTTSTSPALVSAYNLEYGIRNGDACGGNIVCSDPLLVNEPAQGAWPPESALDVFNPFNVGNSFELTSSSPPKYSGVAISGLTTDYYGAARPSPPSMGGVEYGSGPSGSYPGVAPQLFY